MNYSLKGGFKLNTLLRVLSFKGWGQIVTPLSTYGIQS